MGNDAAPAPMTEEDALSASRTLLLLPEDLREAADEATPLLLPTPPEAEQKQPPSPWRPYLYLPCTLLFGLGYSILDTPLQQFVIQKICQTHQIPGSNHTVPCNSSEVQQDIANYHARIAAALILPSILTSTFIAYMSDRIGRKPIFIMLSFSCLLEMWTPYLVATYNLPVFCFIIPKALIGISGGFAVIVSVGFASLGLNLFTTRYELTSNFVVVEITTSESRARVIGTYNGLGVVATLFGTFIGGVLVGKSLAVEAFLRVFRISASLSTLAIVYIVFVVPETLDPKKRRAASSAATAATRTMWARFWSELDAFRTLPPLLLIIQLVSAMAYFKGSYYVQYANYKFGWGTLESAFFSIEQSILSGVTVALLLPQVERALRRFFMKRMAKRDGDAIPTTITEEGRDNGNGAGAAVVNDGPVSENVKRAVTVRLQQVLLRVALVCAVAGSLLFALARSGRVWLAVAPIDAVTAIVPLSMRLILSEFVQPNRLAFVSAVLSLMDSVALLGTVQIAAMIYPNVYFFSAAIYGVALTLSLFMHLRSPPLIEQEQRETTETGTES
ncbi:hypothetical protein HK101_008430 [Irineochytrium annulatum]|nr:hypothetical protein HK101_008430 [Irineochytrium annulatum]